MGTPPSTIVGGRGKHERNEKDFYPTPYDVTHALVNFFILKDIQPRLIWEPAAGRGHMVIVLSAFYNVIGSDILYGQDYLTLDKPDNCDTIITNPPFSLSEQFIQKAVNEVDTVAMLLKSQYWHAKRRLTLFEKHTPAYILPLTWRPNFREELERHNPLMDVMWCVWRKGETNGTQYIPLRRPV